MEHKVLSVKKDVRVTPFSAHFSKAHLRKRIFRPVQIDSLEILTRQ